MNLFEVQEKLKDFSKDQLVGEMQRPSGTAPPYLILSELQRRTRMEQAMQADSQQAPQSSVAEDMVNAAGVPQGGLGDMARALAPQTDMRQNGAAAPVQPAGAPVQQMAEGGQVNEDDRPEGARTAINSNELAQQLRPMAEKLGITGAGLTNAAIQRYYPPQPEPQPETPQVGGRGKGAGQSAIIPDSAGAGTSTRTMAPSSKGGKGGSKGGGGSNINQNQPSQSDLAYRVNNAPTRREREEALEAMKKGQSAANKNPGRELASALMGFRPTPSNTPRRGTPQYGKFRDRYMKAEGGLIRMQEGGSVEEFSSNQMRPMAQNLGIAGAGLTNAAAQRYNQPRPQMPQMSQGVGGDNPRVSEIISQLQGAGQQPGGSYSGDGITRLRDGFAGMGDFIDALRGESTSYNGVNPFLAAKGGNKGGGGSTVNQNMPSESDLAYVVNNAPTRQQREMALEAMRNPRRNNSDDSPATAAARTIFGTLNDRDARRKAEGGPIRMQEGGSVESLVRKEQASPEDMTADEWRTLYGSNWSIMRDLAIRRKNERGPEEGSDTSSGLDRLEAELEAADNPRQRARRLSEIGADVGDFIDYSGRAALRQGDALLGAGTTLGARAGEAALGGLSAASSFLGAPGLGETLENVAGDVRQGRENITQGSGEYMPFGFEGPQLLTRGMTGPEFELPPEAADLYSQAEAQRRLRGLPEGSDVFAEGSVGEPLPSGYGLLPGSKGPSPRGSVITEIEDLVDVPGDLGAPLGYGLGPSEADVAPSYESGPDGRLLQIGSAGGPRPLQSYDVSSGVPMGPGQMEAAVMPTQEDLDNTYQIRMSRPDRFPGEDRVAFERQAAAERRVPLEAFGGTGGGYNLPQPETLGEEAAATYLDTLMTPVFGALSAAGDYITSDSGESPEAEALEVDRLTRESAEEAAALRDEAGITESLRTPEDQAVAAEAARDITGGGARTVPTGGGGSGGGGGGGGISSPLLPSGGAAPGAGGDNSEKWLALARFGLGLMQSQQPTLGGAIGEAGAGALDQLQSAQDREYERDLAERELALKEALTGARIAAAGRSGRGGRGRSLTPNQYVSLAQGRLESVEEALANLRFAGVTDAASAAEEGFADEYKRLMAERRAAQGTLNGIYQGLGFPTAGGYGDGGAEFDAPSAKQG